MPENFSEKAGFGIGLPHNYLIPVGQVTAVDAVLDLGRSYAFLIIACPDTSKAAAPANTLSIKLSYDVDSPLFFLNNNENEKLAAAIGSDGTFWRPYFVGAARRVQLVLSVSPSANMGFVILGADAGVI